MPRDPAVAPRPGRSSATRPQRHSWVIYAVRPGEGEPSVRRDSPLDHHASQSLDPPAILWFARGSGSCSAATLWPELMSAFCASSPRVSAETLVPARTGSPAGGLAASRVRVDGGGGLRSLLEGELRCSATRCLCDDESTSPRAHHASGRGTVSSLRSHSAASKLRASLTPPSADSVAAVLRGSASLQGVAVGPGARARRRRPGTPWRPQNGAEGGA